MLYLSRTSREWRSILLSKSSVWIWNRSLSTVPCDFPQCPSGLSHPAYVHFVFETGCQVRRLRHPITVIDLRMIQSCGKPRTKRSHYELHTRLCKKCADLKIVYEREAKPFLAEVDPQVLDLIPSREYTAYGTSYRVLYLPHIRDMQAKLRNLEDNVAAKAPKAKKKLKRFVEEHTQEVDERVKARLTAYSMCLPEADGRFRRTETSSGGGAIATTNGNGTTLARLANSVWSSKHAYRSQEARLTLPSVQYHVKAGRAWVRHRRLQR